MFQVLLYFRGRFGMTKFLEFLQYSPKLFSFWDLVGTALNAPWYDVRNFMDEASKTEKI